MKIKKKPKLEAFLSDALYVHEDLVTSYHRDSFTDTIFGFYNQGLQETDDFDDGSSDLVVKSYRNIPAKHLVAFARGDLKKISKVFKKFTIYDERSRCKIKGYKLKFKLKKEAKEVHNGNVSKIQVKEQERVKKVWFKKKYGLIEAPPRSGKTVLMIKMLCTSNRKALILAHQKDLLDQFHKDFMVLTNVKSIRDETGKPVIGYLKKWEDVDTYDILLSTWQKWASKKSYKKLKKYKKSFGILMVDECFTYDTPVLIDYDKALPIGDIINNKSITHVLSYDLKNKKIIKRKITRRVAIEHNEKLYDIFIGQNKITCSGNHEIYLKYNKKIKAQDLKVGDQIITYDGYFSQKHICEKCNELFNSHQELMFHKYHKHGDDKSKKHYKKCKVCGKKIHKYSMGFHIKTHDKKFMEIFSNNKINEREKFFKTAKGKNYKKWLSETRQGNNNPFIRGKSKKEIEKTIIKQRKKQKVWWDSLSEKEKNSRIKTFINAPSYKNNPNICETNIINQKIKHLKFTGDGKYFVTLNNKKKNPDFIATNCLSKNKRTSKVIEIMDFEYWHTKKEASYIKKQYKNNGIDCLIIDAKRCYKTQDIMEVRGEIESFINNHYKKITKIKTRTTRKPHLLYNLEIHGTHNYFVVADKLTETRYRQKLGWKPVGVNYNAKNNSYFDTEKYNRIPVLVSNCHKTPAQCYSKVVTNFSALHRIGVTATFERKDQLQVVTKNIMGPVVVKAKIPQMDCTYQIVETGYDPGKFSLWSTLENRLANAKNRNDLIVKLIEKDVKAGHHVVVATRRVKHCKILVDRLRELDIEAEVFNSTLVKREEVLNKARKGEIKVIVAMRAMLLGINVPIWSSFHNTMPTSNPPAYYQEYSRIRTKQPGKRNPVIRDYVDLGRACVSTKFIRIKCYKKDGFRMEKTLSPEGKIRARKNAGKWNKINEKRKSTWVKYKLK